MNDATHPTDHAAAPWICSLCRHHVEQQAEAQPGMPTILKACRHAAHGGVTVAIAFTTGGRVLSWSLQGPLNEREAESVALAYLQTHQQAALGAAKATTRQ